MLSCMNLLDLKNHCFKLSECGLLRGHCRSFTSNQSFFMSMRSAKKFYWGLMRFFALFGCSGSCIENPSLSGKLGLCLLFDSATNEANTVFSTYSTLQHRTRNIYSIRRHERGMQMFGFYLSDDTCSDEMNCFKSKQYSRTYHIFHSQSFAVNIDNNLKAEN